MPASPAAYERCLPEIMALPEKDVRRVNLDVPSVVTKALGVLPGLTRLRSEFERVFRDFDWSLVERLEDYVWALFHADALFRVTRVAASDEEGLLAEGKQLRAVLLSCLKACEQRGLVNPERRARLELRTGFLAVSTHLSVLVSIFTSEPHLMTRQKLVVESDLERASELAVGLLEVAGRQRFRRDGVKQASEVRARAFTLVMRTYERIRLAVQFMRYERGDAHKLAPTLFGKRKPRKRSELPSPRAATGANAANPLLAAVNVSPRALTAGVPVPDEDPKKLN